MGGRWPRLPLGEDAAADVGPFFGGELIEAVVHAHVEAHVVEDEELGLGAEVGGIADAGGAEVGLGPLRQ